MKRAIYVGPTEEYEGLYPQRHPLHYGMTGDFKDGTTFCGFRPDGELNGKFVRRDDIYIPSEDQTRHCPKPS